MKWLFCLLLIWHAQNFCCTVVNDDQNVTAVQQAIAFANQHKAIRVQILATYSGDYTSVDDRCTLIWAEEKK